MSTTPLTASHVIDRERLEREVKAMYRDVAEQPDGAFHFELGRGLAQRLGYPDELLDHIPAAALESFAGVGYALDLAELAPGETVLDLGSGSGTDVFAAAHLVGATGQVYGLDMTDEQLAKAEQLRRGAGLAQVELRKGYIEDLPFDDGSIDAVISNGVINLSADKPRVFAEVARVLRPGGRAAIADIVSSRPLKDRTVAKVELWAACIAGAVPGLDYATGLEELGLRVDTIRENSDYRFITERALSASRTYGVKSVSILAAKR